MKAKDILQTVIAIGLITGMILGALNYFATAKDLQLTQVLIKEEIQKNRELKGQDMIWQLEDRYTIKGKVKDLSEWSEGDRKRYRELKYELEMQKKQEVVK